MQLASVATLCCVYSLLQTPSELRNWTFDLGGKIYEHWLPAGSRWRDMEIVCTQRQQGWVHPDNTKGEWKITNTHKYNYYNYKPAGWSVLTLIQCVDSSSPHLLCRQLREIISKLRRGSQQRVRLLDNAICIEKHKYKDKDKGKDKDSYEQNKDKTLLSSHCWGMRWGWGSWEGGDGLTKTKKHFMF